MATNSPLSAGDIIEARCTKCRAVLNHRIVAMVGGKVVRVECNTCHGTHNYHAPPEAKTERQRIVAAKSSSAPRKTTPAVKHDQAAAEREEWSVLSSAAASIEATVYTMTASYKAGQAVRHPVFGLGFVKTVLAPNKIQVLFQDGMKLLRCQQ